MSTDTTPLAGARPEPLAPDAILVHVGMHKTGTTAMQSVFADIRDELRDEGVLYPGDRESHHREARALTQGTLGWQTAPIPPPEPGVWSDFAAEMRASTSQVVVSSEFFSGATQPQIRQLVHDLGPQRAHVLIGVRNLGPVAVSTWQQTLKQGRVSTLDQWLRQNFQRDDGTEAGHPAQWFWTRFDPAAAVARWAEAAGPDRVTVFVVHDGDRAALPNAFEAFLGLPPGRLAGLGVPRSNRGLTAVEAEAVRRINHELRGRLQWKEYDALVRNGAIRRMIEYRTPKPDEPRPELPVWVVDQVVREGQRTADQILASGVQVVGDLADLTSRPPVADPAAPAPTLDLVPLEAMVEAVVGAVAGATRGSWAIDAEPLEPPLRVSDHTARELATILVGRAMHRARRGLRREQRESEPDDLE